MKYEIIFTLLITIPYIILTKIYNISLFSAIFGLFLLTIIKNKNLNIKLLTFIVTILSLLLSKNTFYILPIIYILYSFFM